MTAKQTASPAADECVPDMQDDVAAAPDAQDEDPEETIAVDYEGRTYAVPKPLKAALMRHGDYTRKTQELALARKAAQAEQEQAVHGDALHRHGLARLQALDGQIAPFTQVDFQALPPQQAAFLARHIAHLKAAREQTAHAIQNHQQNQALTLQRARARQVEEGRAKLRSGIEDWSPEVARQIVQAGKAHGFSDGEIRDVTDPRMILVLNKARLFDEQQARQAQTKRLTAAHAAQPATEVGAQAPATSDPSRMSTAEWMRWRATSLRKRR